MSVSARDQILARIRAAQGKPAVAEAAERESVHAHLAAHAPGPRPRVSGSSAAQFAARARALASTLDTVGTASDVPQAVGEFLKRNALPLAAVCWPEFAGLGWAAAGLEVEARAVRDGDLVGITGAFCAIAETGTLVLLSGPHTPATASLLPETHIALVRAGRI